jgi:hypothetical protein
VNKLVLLGVVLMLFGGALVVFNEFSYDKKHETNILGADLSVTTKESKSIPLPLSGTILGVGAVVTVIGALKGKKRS